MAWQRACPFSSCYSNQWNRFHCGTVICKSEWAVGEEGLCSSWCGWPLRHLYGWCRSIWPEGSCICQGNEGSGVVLQSFLLHGIAKCVRCSHSLNKIRGLCNYEKFRLQKEFNWFKAAALRRIQDCHSYQFPFRILDSIKTTIITWSQMTPDQHARFMLSEWRRRTAVSFVM